MLSFKARLDFFDMVTCILGRRYYRERYYEILKWKSKLWQGNFNSNCCYIKVQSRKEFEAELKSLMVKKISNAFCLPSV